eukprot:1333985-Amphidinium_carterae.1
MRHAIATQKVFPVHAVVSDGAVLSNTPDAMDYELTAAWTRVYNVPWTVPNSAWHVEFVEPLVAVHVPWRDITAPALLEVLRKASVHSSQGPDQWSYRDLKHLPAQFWEPFAAVCNEAELSASWPTAWSEAWD